MSTPGAKNNKFFYENKHLPSVFLQRKMARKFYKNQSHREPLAHKYAITITIQQLKRRLKEAQIKVLYRTICGTVQYRTTRHISMDAPYD